VRFPKTTFEARNTRQPCGQCGRDRTLEAEISAATASIAGVTEPFQVHKIQGFVGFFTMARRLLIHQSGK